MIELDNGGYIHGVCCWRLLSPFRFFLHRFEGIVDVRFFLLHTNDYEAHIDTQRRRLMAFAHCFDSDSDILSLVMFQFVR